MEKAKIYNLASINEVKDFAASIYDHLYYIDNDDVCYSGFELREAMFNSSIPFNSWIGPMKEVAPFDFYYFEKSEIELKNNSIIYYDSDSATLCSSENEAISCCFGEFESLHSFDKKRSIVAAYKCFGIPEYIECYNNSELLAFAIHYNNHDYFCSSNKPSPSIVFQIDNDLRKFDLEGVYENDGDFWYFGKIEGICYKFKINAANWKEYQEIEEEEKNIIIFD